MRQALVLIHDYGDTLGTLTDGLLEQRFACKYWSPVVQAEPPLDPASLDLLIVLGGAAHPWCPDHRDWQRREMSFIERAIAKGVPTLGICLGAQLIALSLGASVRRLNTVRVGPLPIISSGATTLLDPYREGRFHVFKWHEYGFDCPGGASRLAVGSEEICEAFSFQDHVFATQFHIEATSDVFQGWMLETLQGLEGKTQALQDAVRTQGPSIEAASRTVFRDWLAQVVGKRAPQTPSVIRAIPERGVADAV